MQQELGHAGRRRRGAGRVGGRAGVPQARGRTSGRVVGRGRGAAGERGARGRGAGRARPGRWLRGLGVGCAACAHRLGQLGARALGLVFNRLIRLGIFPESPNEHCSL